MWFPKPVTITVFLLDDHEIVRRGLPYRVPVRARNPDGTPFERYPRVGFDRPKASDHCPVVIELEIPDDGRSPA